MRAGGRFLVTTTNADWLIKKLSTLPEHELGTHSKMLIYKTIKVLNMEMFIY